jgi:hypothetical protein
MVILMEHSLHRSLLRKPANTLIVLSTMSDEHRTIRRPNMKFVQILPNTSHTVWVENLCDNTSVRWGRCVSLRIGPDYHKLDTDIFNFPEPPSSSTHYLLALRGLERNAESLAKICQKIVNYGKEMAIVCQFSRGEYGLDDLKREAEKHIPDTELQALILLDLFPDLNGYVKIK